MLKKKITLRNIFNYWGLKSFKKKFVSANTKQKRNVEKYFNIRKRKYLLDFGHKQFNIRKSFNNKTHEIKIIVSGDLTQKGEDGKETTVWTSLLEEKVFVLESTKTLHEVFQYIAKVLEK